MQYESWVQVHKNVKSPAIGWELYVNSPVIGLRLLCESVSHDLSVPTSLC